MISLSVVCIYMHVANVPAWACCYAVAIHMQWLYIVLEHSRWSLIDRLDDVYRDIADIVYLLDVLVVVVHISHSNCWTTYYCTRIEVRVLRAGRRRGVGVGVGVGKRYTSSYDHDMCDRLKLWSGPAWRSKVIIRKPWRQKNKIKKY